MRKMILGASTDDFINDTICERFQAIAGHGFRYANIVIDRELSQEEIDEMIICKNQLGIIPGQMTSTLFPEEYQKKDDFEKAKLLGQSLINIQAQFGGNVVGFSAGVYKKNKANHKKHAVELSQALCDFSKNHNIIIAMNLSPEKNQVVSKWEEALEFYTEVDRDNFMININTAYVNFIHEPIRALQFLKGKLPQCQIADNDAKDYDNKLNVGEGTADIKKWVQALQPLVEETCHEIADTTQGVIRFNDSSKDEVKRTLRYLEKVLPKLKL